MYQRGVGYLPECARRERIHVICESDEARKIVELRFGSSSKDEHSRIQGQISSSRSDRNEPPEASLFSRFRAVRAGVACLQRLHWAMVFNSAGALRAESSPTNVYATAVDRGGAVLPAPSTA